MQLLDKKGLKIPTPASLNQRCNQYVLDSGCRSSLQTDFLGFRTWLGRFKNHLWWPNRGPRSPDNSPQPASATSKRSKALLSLPGMALVGHMTSQLKKNEPELSGVLGAWCHTAFAPRTRSARKNEYYFSACLHNRSISGKDWDTKYRREEEDEWNRDVARLIDTLFRGQLHRNSLIFYTLLDHFLISWSGEDAVKKVKRHKNDTKVFLFCILIGSRLNISPTPAPFWSLAISLSVWEITRVLIKLALFWRYLLKKC